MGSKGGPAASESVDALGIKVLAFIVADVDRIIPVLNVTGLQPETLRESAQSSLFLLGVLDYVSKDDELLRALHQQLDIAPAAILTALGHQTPTSETKPRDRKIEAAPSLP
jgi:CheY-like chemotaxis protein